MPDGFNATTVSFDGNGQTPLVSANYDGTAAEVDVTGAADSEHTYEPGITDETITWEVVGIPPGTIALGDTGATVVEWGGVGADNWGSFANAVITAISPGGGIDGAKTTSVTAKPYNA